MTDQEIQCVINKVLNTPKCYQYTTLDEMYADGVLRCTKEDLEKLKASFSVYLTGSKTERQKNK